MKNVVIAFCALLLVVTTVSTFAGITTPTKPDPKLTGWRNGVINTSNHRATFDSAVSPGCNTPQHRGLTGAHGHSYQTMHTNGCSTSGNWWNAAKTIWQLKQSWCACEGWGIIKCNGTGGAYVIQAFCTYV